MPLRIRHSYFLALPFLFISCSDNSSVVDPSSDAMRQAISLRSVVLSAYAFDTDTISVSPGKQKLPDDPITVTFTVTVVMDAGSAAQVKDLTCDILTDKDGSNVASLDLGGGRGNTFSGLMKI